MNKINKKLFLLPILLLSLGACNVNPNLELQDEDITSKQPDLDIKQENHKVILPTNIPGIQFSVNNDNPKAYENVTLSVHATSYLSKRVDKITMNGMILNGYSSSDQNITYYNFAMPLNEDAVIEAEVVDVYQIKIADEVKDYLALDYSITPRVAAEGETVQFKVASYAGYWFKSVTIAEDDVILTEQENIYSFTMPAHDVTITAITGEQAYALHLKTADEDAEDAKYYRFVGIQDGQAFTAGSEVKFTVETTNVDYKINQVLLEDKELSLVEDAVEYSFIMPAYDVDLACLWDVDYREVVGAKSAHYQAVLTTDVDGEIVPVDHNVVKGQLVYVDYEELPGEENKFIVDGYSYRGGDDAESAETISISLTYSQGKQYFEVPEQYKYIEVTPVEREVMFKNSPYVASYDTGLHTYYGSDISGSLNEDGVLKIGTYVNNYQLVSDAEDPNHYTVSGKEGSHFFVYDDDFILFYSGTGKGDTYLLTKNHGTRILPNDSNGFTYSVAVLNAGNANKVDKQFLKLSLAGITSEDEDLAVAPTELNVYVDYTINKVYWDVECVVINGSGYLQNDIFAIKESGVEDDTYLDVIKVDTVKKYSDGYQHFGSFVEPIEEKTYNGELGALVFDKWGGATLGGVRVLFEKTSNEVTITKGETTYKVTLKDDDLSYEVTFNSDTDDFSQVVGMWLAEEEPLAGNQSCFLTIDEAGKAVLNATGDDIDTKWQNVEFDFKVRNGNDYTFESLTNGELIVTLKEDKKSITFVYEQGGADGSTVYQKTSEFFGKKYTGKTSGSYYTDTIAVEFVDTENCVVTVSSYTDNATYTYDEDTKTIHVTISTPHATFDLVVQSDGRLQVKNFVADNGYSHHSVYTSYINNIYLTEVE